jgi:hypothetical protein
MTSSDGIPLVVKTGDELPAVSWGDDLNTFTWYSRERY